MRSHECPLYKISIGFGGGIIRCCLILSVTVVSVDLGTYKANRTREPCQWPPGWEKKKTTRSWLATGSLVSVFLSVSSLLREEIFAAESRQSKAKAKAESPGMVIMTWFLGTNYGSVQYWTYSTYITDGLTLILVVLRSYTRVKHRISPTRSTEHLPALHLTSNQSVPCPPLIIERLIATSSRTVL